MPHWLLLLQLAGAATTLDVGAVAELRTRVPGDAETETELYKSALDTSINGTASLGVQAKRTSLSLDYSPALAVLDYLHPARRLTLNHGFGLRAKTLGARWQLGATASGSVGYRSYSPLLGGYADLYPGQILPVVTVGIKAATPQVDASYRLGARHTLTAAAGYVYSAALDDTSSKIVPTSYGPTADVGYLYSLSAADDLGLEFGAQQRRTEPGALSVADANLDVLVLQANALWSHTLQEPVLGEEGGATFSLRAGAAITRSRLKGETTWSPVAPVGAGQLGGLFAYSIKLGSAGTIATGANLGVSTIINQTTGTTDQRALASGRVDWTRKRTTVALTGNGTRSLDLGTVGAAASYQGALTARHELHRTLFVQVGARAAYVDVDPELQVGQSVANPQWAFFVGLGGQLDTLRF